MWLRLEGHEEFKQLQHLALLNTLQQTIGHEGLLGALHLQYVLLIHQTRTLLLTHQPGTFRFCFHNA